MNLLDDFAGLENRNRKLVLALKILYGSILATIIPFALLHIFDVFTASELRVDIGTFFLIGGVILLLLTLYLIIKENKTGWLLLSLISGLLWSIFAKIVYFYASSFWEINSIRGVCISCIILLSTSALLPLLYLKKTRRVFNIDISFIAISIFLNILTITIVLVSFN